MLYRILNTNLKETYRPVFEKIKLEMEKKVWKRFHIHHVYAYDNVMYIYVYIYKCIYIYMYIYNIIIYIYNII